MHLRPVPRGLLLVPGWWTGEVGSGVLLQGQQASDEMMCAADINQPTTTAPVVNVVVTMYVMQVLA
jgi:hypothetical protein